MRRRCNHVGPRIRQPPLMEVRTIGRAHRLLDTIQKNHTSACTLVPQPNYLLVRRRFVPGFSRLSRRKLDDHRARMLPFAFKHGQVAPADDFKGAREQLGENRQQFLSDSFQLPLFYTWN